MISKGIRFPDLPAAESRTKESSGQKCESQLLCEHLSGEASPAPVIRARLFGKQERFPPANADGYTKMRYSLFQTTAIEYEKRED